MSYRRLEALLPLNVEVFEIVLCKQKKTKFRR